MQLPGATSVRSTPLTVHTVAGLAVKATVNPLLAEASSVIGPSSGATGALRSWSHAITCALRATVKDLLTLVAATTVAEPAWAAVMVHVPAVRTVITPVELLTVQTAAVDELKVIGSEADDEADTVGAGSR